MKDSNPAWLENVPTHWDKVRLRWLTERNDNGVWGEDPNENEGRIVLRSTEQTKRGGWQIENPARRYVEKEVAAEKTLKEGDLVVTTSSGSEDHLGKTSYVTSEVANLNPLFSNFNQRIRTTDRISARFVYWLLNSTIGRSQMNYQSSTSTGLNNLSGNIIANVVSPLPPSGESRQIAEYLDIKIEEIDEAIKSASNTKERVKDRLQSTVYQTVIKGVSEDCELKESEAGWIGEVPDHWDVVRTRFVARLHSGHTPDRSKDEYWADTNIPWVTTSDIKPFRDGRKRYLDETEHEISELGMKNSGAHLLPEGTVFLSRTASVGFSGIMGKPMATSQDFANWVCGDKILPEYLLYVFRSMDQEFERLMQGSTHKTIYMPDIQSFKTPLPPLDEQREIVEQIETETDRLWKLIERVEETIDLLEEKRRALITAAITGQIDMSEVQGESQDHPT